MNPNPNPNLNPHPHPHPPHSESYYNSHHSYYSQNPSIPYPFPNVYPDPSSDVNPPGVESYPGLTHPHGLSYEQPPDASGYYYDHILQGWVLPQYPPAVSVSGLQTGMEQLGVPQQASTVWPIYPYQLHGNGNSNKRIKKTKVVQSAYCEVCKVDCNSKDVLDNHKLGKKHKKNLEKLQVAAAGPSVSSVPVSQPPIGPKIDPNKTISTPSSILRAKKKASTLENLETKRQKIVEGGAAQEAVRVCAICNVVCNSEGVYQYHLSGKKHATMMRKQMSGA
ncbi:hypothetical protein M5689_007497 [Euphorbia peplus]|nr:hypothetical protein M5689_007497 [Euphorbia peplus]